jgi:hypothetical protein
MSTIELEDQEWQQVMNIISGAPWRDANPLLMKIGQQLQRQVAAARGIYPGNGGKEAHNGEQRNTDAS